MVVTAWMFVAQLNMQPSYARSTIVTFSPRRFADGFAHVAVDRTRAEGGRAVARCRRYSEKSSPPDFMGHVVGRTVSDPVVVVGSGRPRSMDVSRVR